jgi:hypothetical protein
MDIIIGGAIIELKNSTLSGKTLDQLNSGEADFALVASLVVDFRQRIFSFLQPVSSTMYLALLQKNDYFKHLILFLFLEFTHTLNNHLQILFGILSHLHFIRGCGSQLLSLGFF